MTEKTALLGFGRANRAACRYLVAGGGDVTVYAEAPIDKALQAAFSPMGVHFAEPGFPVTFAEKILVRSPGIRPDIPSIRASLAAGAVLTGETELFLESCSLPVIGVTGSDGKSTTSALIAALVTAAGKSAYLGGNNGHPLLSRLSEMREGIAVAELSSFQLMTVTKPPQVAVMTNITPNHLNWHLDMAEYVAAKCRIFDAHTALILNADDPLTKEIGAKRGEGNTCYFALDVATLPHGAPGAFLKKGRVILRGAEGEQTLDCLGAFRLPGRHNLENLLAALSAVDAAGIPLHENTVKKALSGFTGVPHRLQRVDVVRGVTYIDSSIDTSPTRTAAALSAVNGSPLVIAGGRGKGVSLQPLGDLLTERAAAAFLYGEAAVEIEEAIGGRISTHRFDCFANAFCAAAEAAVPGDTVLLSPGCTAFGEFRDFEERGETFCRLVKKLKK